MEKSLRVIVTGANKGIGYGIVEKFLTASHPYHVIMACRTIENGEDAKKKLIQEFNVSEDRIVVQ